MLARLASGHPDGQNCSSALARSTCTCRTSLRSLDCRSRAEATPDEPWSWGSWVTRWTP